MYSKKASIWRPAYAVAKGKCHLNYRGIRVVLLNNKFSFLLQRLETFSLLFLMIMVSFLVKQYIIQIGKERKERFTL